MTAVAEALSEKRRKAARTLGRAIDETLRELGLREAALKVVVEDREELGPRGRDRVRFSFAPNPGEEPRPLARIASGGELSRVMLAVKRALARSDQALTYVFDEVDTGVGGGTAEVIGRKLKAIAATARSSPSPTCPRSPPSPTSTSGSRRHASGGRTTARVEVLNERERAAEIARMLAGAQPSREADRPRGRDAAPGPRGGLSRSWRQSRRPARLGRGRDSERSASRNRSEQKSRETD